MNLRTTLALVVFVVAGGVLFWLGPDIARRLGLVPEPVDATGAGTLTVLADDLTPAKLNRIEIKRGDQHVELEGGEGRDWALPGRWPVRQEETKKLVDALTHLHSRFVPLALGDSPDLKRYGLDDGSHPVHVTVRTAGVEHHLTFGEADEPGESDPFTRPTYLRVDDKPEVVRLAPGLLAVLKASRDDYEKRRLFPDFAQIKIKSFDMPDFSNPGMPQEPRERDKLVELFDDQELSVTRGHDRYGIKRLSNMRDAKDPNAAVESEEIARHWELFQPVRDRVDEKKLEAILGAVPDIWAERFVDSTSNAADLAKYGLDKPEATVRVRKANGDTVTLLIGKSASGSLPPPEPPSPTAPRPDSFRYAKLDGNEQIFEIKSTKLDESLFVTLKDLRDARVARFRPEDAQRVTISHGREEIVLVKENEQWRLQKPVAASAEYGKVSDLLDKLAHLEARGDDVTDRADPKFGLDKPAATVHIDVREDRPGNKHAETLTFVLGKRDAAKAKGYIRLDGFSRINFVDDSVFKLAERPALAYRGRNVLDSASDAIAGIDIQRGGEHFSLAQANGKWRLTAPVQADADNSKANQLAGDLGRLEAVEFVSENPKADELSKVYGLAAPAVRATLRFSDAKKPSQTLVVGKQRPDKPEYYARLLPADSKPGKESAPVFVVKDDIWKALEQASLAYLPLELWKTQADEIAGLTIRRAGQEFQVKRDGKNWRIVQPFAAAALAPTVEAMTKELADPRGDRYVVYAPKDLKPYGLDKPFLQVTLHGGRGDKAGTKHSLQIGSPTAPGAKTRYAKLADGRGVVVVSDALVAALDHGALDLLDRRLLSLNESTIAHIEKKQGNDDFTLTRAGSTWRAKSEGGTFVADRTAIDGLLATWSNLEAERFAAYGAKLDLAAYGLDKPMAAIKVAVSGAGSKPGGAAEHRLLLGKSSGNGGRFARLDDGPAVCVLGASVVGELERGPLDFVERGLLTFDAAKVTALKRHAGANDLEIVKHDDGWQLVKPAAHKADDASLDGLIGQLSALRAERVAAYRPKDVKSFGLDAPAAVVTLAVTGQAKPPTLKIGKEAAASSPGKPADHFVQVEGSDVVGVLDGLTCRRLLVEPLKFRDRLVAQFTDADRAILQRGVRRAVFAKVDGTWKLTQPILAEAEQSDLEDLVNAFARLRADEWVTEKAADLKPYGLDKPAVRWQFYDGDKEVLNVLVGARKGADDSRGYAKLASGGQVFLLDSKATAKAFAEYRTRSVWSGVDAAQVETLQYGYAQHPFTLQKAGGLWELFGSPGAKVKSDAVTETLDALARLRVERYVADKDGDMKLYGLEPPELVLTVQSPSGRKVLHIGRMEGGSQRYYARVPEGNRSDVFVISAADAQKIVRSLNAFVPAAAPNSHARK